MRIFALTVIIYFFAGNTVLNAQNNKGIGINFNRNAATGIDTVAVVYAGNAAADAGIRVGDGLLAVGKSDLSQLSTGEVIALLKGGPDGAGYNLKIIRKIQTTLGEKLKEMELQITPREVLAQACLSGDCKNGTGNLMHNATGIRMEGAFTEGNFTKGKVYYKSGRLWMDGTFVSRKMNGVCTDYYDQPGSPVASKGRFENGVLRDGISSSADGKTVKEGIFDEDEILHGDNVSIKLPGFSYHGNMVHGKMTGETTRMTMEGGHYSGPVINGKADGKGKLVVGKTTYKGTWRDGKREGKFRVINKMGGTFETVNQYENGILVR